MENCGFVAGVTNTAAYWREGTPAQLDDTRLSPQGAFHPST